MRSQLRSQNPPLSLSAVCRPTDRDIARAGRSKRPGKPRPVSVSVDRGPHRPLFLNCLKLAGTTPFNRSSSKISAPTFFGSSSVTTGGSRDASPIRSGTEEEARSEVFKGGVLWPSRPVRRPQSAFQQTPNTRFADTASLQQCSVDSREGITQETQSPFRIKRPEVTITRHTHSVNGIFRIVSIGGIHFPKVDTT